MTALLQTHNLTAYYGQFQALFGVNIELHQGEVIAIIGANGAGKTTLMHSLTGLVKNANESITFKGQAIGNMPAYEVVKQGIAIVLEERKLFPSLSVEENLLVGNYGREYMNGYWNLDNIYSLFPILKERRHTPSTALSGGQQQMVSIGRALMSNPQILLCDELSLGLAPIVIKDIYESIPEIKASGTSIVIVEQDIGQAMQQSDRIYCMMEGQITLSGTPDSLSKQQIHNAYFGVST